MLEFVPGRRYFFQTPTGQHVGTFVAKTKLGLRFTNVVRFVEASREANVTFNADKFLDAEPWLQSIELADSMTAVNVPMHKQIAKDLKARKAVVIERATPGKDW